MMVFSSIPWLYWAQNWLKPHIHPCIVMSYSCKNNMSAFVYTHIRLPYFSINTKYVPSSSCLHQSLLFIGIISDINIYKLRNLVLEYLYLFACLSLHTITVCDIMVMIVVFPCYPTWMHIGIIVMRGYDYLLICYACCRLSSWSDLGIPLLYIPDPGHIFLYLHV